MEGSSRYPTEEDPSIIYAVGGYPYVDELFLVTKEEAEKKLRSKRWKKAVAITEEGIPVAVMSKQPGGASRIGSVKEMRLTTVLDAVREGEIIEAKETGVRVMGLEQYCREVEKEVFSETLMEELREADKERKERAKNGEPSTIPGEFVAAEFGGSREGRGARERLARMIMVNREVEWRKLTLKQWMTETDMTVALAKKVFRGEKVSQEVSNKVSKWFSEEGRKSYEKLMEEFTAEERERQGIRAGMKVCGLNSMELTEALVGEEKKSKETISKFPVSVQGKLEEERRWILKQIEKDRRGA